MRKLIATLCVLTLVFAAASVAVAQDAETIRAIFESAPKEPTNIRGVSIFQGPPKGFNALNASGEELARYGLPQRPNQLTEPEHYAKWARAVTSTRYRASAQLKELPWHGSPAKLMPSNVAEQAVSNVPVTEGSYNWSAVVNTNKNTKWSTTTSFTYVESLWPVPVAQPPVGACANGITGPFLESTWNGIDGFNSGDVIQGGTQLYSDCNGNNSYVAWVEWYPSYAELEIWCGSGPCPVGPGDVMYVVTYGTKGTANQTVYVNDTTQGWSGSFSLAWVTGPGVIGNSEEQVVERPCCNGSNFYALDHYNYEWFSDALGSDGHGTVFYGGEQTASTFLLQMYEDSGTSIISEVVEQGSAGSAGKYSLFFSDEGCTVSGGCTP